LCSGYRITRYEWLWAYSKLEGIKGHKHASIVVYTGKNSKEEMITA
jgi:hypothetical protein